MENKDEVVISTRDITPICVVHQNSPNNTPNFSLSHSGLYISETDAREALLLITQGRHTTLSLTGDGKTSASLMSITLRLHGEALKENEAEMLETFKKATRDDTNHLFVEQSLSLSSYLFGKKILITPRLNSFGA
ncbi:hypothetical protein CEXT_491321 [Caerostris extrusa]|uniref:Uncharacterized protein n=1 Tax=Caerostris extrusa TaxID=172846 RepID=A0AAV4SZ70_CAEEX|nr:hypothetical protein CEXT_491321 [Caerostris extrusa]